jgi:hypothetical protein
MERTPAAALQFYAILRSASSAAFAAATAALISAMRAADCSSLCSLLVRENERFDCVRGLQRSASFGHTVAAGAWGGTAGPAGPPGPLIAMCGDWAGPGK